MIPRVIHQMWVGPPLPFHIAAMMDTWRTHHPEWEIRFWTSPPKVNRDLWDRAEEITPEAPEQFRSDVARYEILYEYGGVWVDADFVCQKPLDDLMGVEAFAGREGRWLNNALIGIVPAHPLMAELISKLPANVDKYKPHQGNTVKSGPQFFTPLARKHRVVEHPQSLFYPYLWNQLTRGADSFPDAYTVHHWNHRRHGAPV